MQLVKEIPQLRTFSVCNQQPVKTGMRTDRMQREAVYMKQDMDGRGGQHKVYQQ